MMWETNQGVAVLVDEVVQNMNFMFLRTNSERDGVEFTKGYEQAVSDMIAGITMEQQTFLQHNKEDNGKA